MHLIKIFLYLFLAGAVFNLFNGDYPNAIAGLGVAMFFGSIYFFFLKEENQSIEFLAWLHDHQDILKTGQALYDHKPISIGTEVTRFQACVSLIVVSSKCPSRFFIRGYDNIFGIGAIYSLVTLVLGWWGIPWGPVYTVQVLYHNIRGGLKTTVAQLIEEMNAAVEEIEQAEEEESD